MSITVSELNEIINIVCPHCTKGRRLEFRQSTNEWAHSWSNGQTVSQTICWATNLRNSHFAKRLLIQTTVGNDG